MKKLSYLVALLVVFLFCSCEPGPKPEEEAKTYKITLINGDVTKDYYYKGSNWYSDESCATKIFSITPESNVEYIITYDLNDFVENKSSSVEGCTPSSITEDKYKKATKTFKGYFYNSTQIVSETGSLLEISNITEDIEAPATFETASITLPIGIISATKEFKGWYTTPERTGDVAPSSFVPDGNTKFYAKWEDTGERNIYFEFPVNPVKIEVNWNEISVDEPYKIDREGSLEFNVPKSDGYVYNALIVQYKKVGESDDKFKSLEADKYNYFKLEQGQYNTIIRITTLTSITLSYNDKIKYKTLDDKEIEVIDSSQREKPINIYPGEDYSFKVVNSYDPSSYYVKYMLMYGEETVKELLPDDDGVCVITKEELKKGIATGIKVRLSFLSTRRLFIYNTDMRDVLNVRRVVGDRSASMPAEFNDFQSCLSLRIPKDEETFSFMLELKDPTQYEISEVQLQLMESEILTPSIGGVYTFNGVDSWTTDPTLKVVLNAFWYPLTVEGEGVKVVDTRDGKEINRFTANEQYRVAIEPIDSSLKVISSVEITYRKKTGGSFVSVTKQLPIIRNNNGESFYTISSDMTIGDVKLAVSLADKNITLTTLNDSVKWSLEDDRLLPSNIERYSYINFRVTPITNDEIVGVVNVSYGEIKDTLLPNEEGVYTLTPDITSYDSITLSATTKQPASDISVKFSGDGVVFMDNSSGTPIMLTNIKEGSEFKFSVKPNNPNEQEIDRVFVVYNKVQKELKESDGLYILSRFITTSNLQVVAQVKNKFVSLTLDSASDYTMIGVNGEQLKGYLPYKTEYKFKIVPNDTSKKITRIRVQCGDSEISADYLYEDNTGIYTLPSDDVTDNITLVADTVNKNGEELTVIENGKTVRVSSPNGRIPYVLITNFTPSKTYASEPLRSLSKRSNSTYNYSLVPNDTSQTSLYSNVAPRTVSTVSSPRMKNGKVIWENYSFNGGAHFVDYEELYTDTDNKIIYMLSTKVDGKDSFSVGDDSPARAIIDYIYTTTEVDAKMTPNLLETIQKTIAQPSETFPNKAYLFDKSETDRGYFFVMMDKFEERGGGSGSVLGYFSGNIYVGNDENTPYATFFLNADSSLFDEKEEDDTYFTHDFAMSFISTFSHEYTHYVLMDYRNTRDYENLSSLHFLSEGYANYNAARSTKYIIVDTSYIIELLMEHKVYDPKNRDSTCYALGHLFFLYIEEKYGKDMPGKIMTDDKAVFKAVEDQTGKTFGELYKDFILNLVLSGFIDTASIDGVTYSDMSFATTRELDFYNPKGGYIFQHGFETEFTDWSKRVKQYKEEGTEDEYVLEGTTPIYEDVKMILEKDEGITSVLGEMSFRLVCYPNGAPSTLTLSSDSPFIKAYLFYSTKNPLESL